MTKSKQRNVSIRGFVATALAVVVVGCNGPEGAQAAPQPVVSGGQVLSYDRQDGGAIYLSHGGADPRVTVLDLNGFGLATGFSSPLAGGYFNDGGDGDVRARTENLYRFLEPRRRDMPAEQHDDIERFDEVVVVERADGTKVDYGPDRYASLRARVDGRPLGLPLPLERTDVHGRVALNVGSVTVRQHFTNPYAGKIEAVYVFPLPQDAAVSDFVMVIGERRIRGIVRDRDEAQQIYQQAKAQGYQASLLSQERPNLFTQSVANIEPGQAIDIETTYFQALAWRDGAFEMVVPTVVGPRFNPPGSRDGVGAVAAGAEGTSGQATEVAYLPPSAAGAHRIGIRVDLDAGMPLGDIGCATHPVTITRDGERRASIALRDGDDVPNRDFVLRFAPRQQDLGGAVAVHRDPQTGEGWFTMLLQPPLATVDVAPQPREMIFVVDCSGSMSGEPLAACKRAIRRCLQRLGPTDTFLVIRFSNDASALGSKPLPATPENVRQGLRYVDGLEADGGTMMERGITAALAPACEPGRRRIVTFMTDGYIGNEADILRAVHEHVGEARIFSFGVGSSVNRYLLERMADLGRGIAAYLGLDDSAQQQVDELYGRLERPALADLAVDWGTAQVSGLEPQRLPDLFGGRPLLVHGKVQGPLPRTVRVRGRMGAQVVSFDLPVSEAREHPAIARLWARARIRSLNDARVWVRTPGELDEEIRALALRHGLASSFTSFVAVDSTRITEGDHGTTVKVPVEVPRGVRYETTVSGGER